MKNLTLLGFVVVFEIVLLVIAGFKPVFDPVLLVSLALASSFAGSAIAYMPIFAWARAPFTHVVSHSSGAGESVEPTEKHPILNVIGMWICCPLCAGTWAGAMMVLAYAVNPDYGQVLIYILGTAGLGTVVTRHREMIEWQGRLAWEQTGMAQKQNKVIDNVLEQAEKIEDDRKRLIEIEKLFGGFNE
jgi:hypothetical protein